MTADKRSGFSLLELLMVVAILSLLGTAGVGYYRNTVESTRLEATARTIISDLRGAREKSIAGEDDMKWGIHFVNGTAPSASDYYELFSTPAGYGHASTTVKQTVFLPLGVEFSDPAPLTPPNNQKDVIFDKIKGTAIVSTSVSIVLEGETRTVIVSAQGEIR